MRTNPKITGSVQPKNNKWYMIINLYDSNNKRKPKWINTGLAIRGNKKNAEKLLQKELERYNENGQLSNDVENDNLNDILFCNFCCIWLKNHKKDVSHTSFASDQNTVEVHLYPYFKEKNILLKDICSEDINQYFNDKMNGYGGRQPLSGTSLLRHNATISSILTCAIELNIIQKQQISKIKRPQNDTKEVNWYTPDQVQQLIDCLKENNNKLLLPVIFASCFGLRREEIVGIRISDIDFKNHLLKLQHSIVVGFMHDENSLERRTIYRKQDKLKSKASERVFPLSVKIEQMIRDLIGQKEIYRELFGNKYNTENLDYLFVHENGNLFRPDYITHAFGKFIKKYNFPKITLHGLRHSNASFLLKSGYTLREIQDWLGHSSYNTTLRYTHIYSDYKNNMQSTILDAIKL